MRQEEKKKCWFCRGSGKQLCGQCGGSGIRTQMDLSYISVIGTAIPMPVPCWKCHGTGMERCQYCHGTGERE